MIRRLLIANRGEIACRIAATARRMGIATVAVYSDADAGARHVAMADVAVRIGPAAPSESYLNAAAILAAAHRTGADAVHPGYGFLSENAGFAEAVAAAGLTFVGPPAEAIRAMGLKDAAKRAMEDAGVPVVPGWHGADQDPATLAEAAATLGWPVLIKARAGGGGRGMRRVERPEEFGAALDAARREAEAAFGDGAVLVEKWIASPRHVEVQVLADAHGRVLHLFERDCSLQRRHQKVIEEAPAPGMTDAVRATMGEAAVAAAHAIGYRGAGTVEFIADGRDGLRPDRFWFMEMNTRLQVEHPVTEAVTGLDLVEWQLRVAAGEALPWRQEDLALDGHAVEARLYAEDPARGFLPSPGRLTALRWPVGAAEFAAGPVRVDAGVREGDAIPPDYDPLIAKVIAHGPDRAAALARLAAALAEVRVAGVATNLGFLSALVGHPDVLAGHLDTGLIGRAGAVLTDPPPAPPDVLGLAALAALGLLAPPGGTGPWDSLRGWRAWGASVSVAVLIEDGTPREIAVTPDGDGWRVLTGEDEARIAVLGPPHDLRMEAGGTIWPAAVIATPAEVTVFSDGHVRRFVRPDPMAFAEDAAATGNIVTAPMPGRVVAVLAVAGDSVAHDTVLIVLEAMKMEQVLRSPRNGVLAEIAAEGAQVAEGAVLARLEPEDG